MRRFFQFFFPLVGQNVKAKKTTKTKTKRKTPEPRRYVTACKNSTTCFRMSEGPGWIPSAALPI